jgi:hypothetical protein
LDRGLAQAFHVNAYARAAQSIDPPAIHAAVRVERWHHHAAHTACDDAADARRRVSVVHTRLQSHVHGAAAGTFTRSFQRDDFAMGLAAALVKPLADDLAVADDHRTHHWVGTRVPGRRPREIERTSHVRLVNRGRRVANNNLGEMLGNRHERTDSCYNE